MSHYIPARATPVTMAACFASFRRVALDLGPESLLTLLAQIHLESDAGASVRNFNLGGARTRPFGRFSWTFFDTHEGKGANRRLVKAPPLEQQPTSTDPAACFRAEESLDAATTAHVALIRDEFPDAYFHVVAGKPYDYGLALADDVGKLYHTSDREAYARGIVSRVEMLRAQMPRWSADS